MKSHSLKYQNGVALIIFVLMLMGVGGYLLAGYSQGLLKQVEHKKTEHNTRVLIEAKQALLQFAYNYPVTNGNGPGRLPCADIDNDGDANDNDDGDDDVTTDNGECIALGHLPWNEPNLNLYDIRDADGQRLWYAVSDNFATNVAGGNTINSDTSGTITVRDQSGNVIYNGLNPTGLFRYGVAAIIIAPGDITARSGVAQDRSVANADDPFDTTADTDPGIINAANYLDRLVGTEDNANFTQDSAVDGFILGPVNIQSTNAINDQMIVITAAEVIEVAEKATLQAYRTALQAYDQRIDTDVGAGDHYPWLFNYGSAAFPVNDYGGGYPELDDYPSDPVFATEMANYLGRNGRVPSIFSNYFTEADGQPIESHLRVNLTLDYPTSPPVGFNQAFAMCPSNPAIFCTSGVLDFDSGTTRVFNVLSTDPLINVTFEDTDPNVFSANDGRLTATYVSDDTVSDVRYFWDEEPVGNGWRECLDGGNILSDCNRDGAGNPDPGGVNVTPSQILRIRIDVNLTGPVIFDMDYGVNPVVTIVNSADGGQHANISGTFVGANLDADTLPVVVSYQYDHFYSLAFNMQASGTLALADFMQEIGSSLALTLRYYPELPDWVSDNGWDDSILMAYASDYQPGGGGGPCTAGTDCLQINNFGGIDNDKISLLTIAGQHDWDDGGGDGLWNDIGDVFDFENDDLDDTFEVRAANGNDEILVIDEL